METICLALQSRFGYLVSSIIAGVSNQAWQGTKAHTAIDATRMRSYTKGVTFMKFKATAFPMWLPGEPMANGGLQQNYPLIHSVGACLRVFMKL